MAVKDIATASIRHRFNVTAAETPAYDHADFVALRSNKPGGSQINTPLAVEGYPNLELRFWCQHTTKTTNPNTVPLTFGWTIVAWRQSIDGDSVPRGIRLLVGTAQAGGSIVTGSHPMYPKEEDVGASDIFADVELITVTSAKTSDPTTDVVAFTKYNLFDSLSGGDGMARVVFDPQAHSHLFVYLHTFHGSLGRVDAMISKMG